VARLADRSSRVNIIAVAVALWSLVVVLSATVEQFWSRRGTQYTRVSVRLVAIATALISPFVIMALWCPSARAALLFLLPAQSLMMLFFAPTYSFVHGLCEANVRATTTSIFILIQVLMGGVIGMQLLGALSDILISVVGSGGAACGGA